MLGDGHISSAHSQVCTHIHDVFLSAHSGHFSRQPASLGRIVRSSGCLDPPLLGLNVPNFKGVPSILRLEYTRHVEKEVLTELLPSWKTGFPKTNIGGKGLSSGSQELQACHAVEYSHMGHFPVPLLVL